MEGKALMTSVRMPARWEGVLLRLPFFRCCSSDVVAPAAAAPLALLLFFLQLPPLVTNTP